MRDNLQEWLDYALVLEAIYRRELNRSAFSDPQAFVNWTYHWANGQTPDWVQDRIRESDEWKQKHSGTVPQPPATPPDVVVPARPARGFRKISITDDRDGRVPRRMYSYWSNAVVLGDSVFVFCGNADGSPRFFEVTSNDRTKVLGPMIGYRGETEGWCWDKKGRLLIAQGPQMHLVNPFNGEDEVLFDISGDMPGHNLWQPHTSDDGRIHCATVRQNSNEFNPHVKTIIVKDGNKQYVPVFGKQDESHLTASGNHCIIEEDDNNRIVDVVTGREQLILDADGALSHIDCGPDYMVGEDNINGRAWKIDLPSLQRTELEQTWGMGHVSTRAGRCLLSNSGSLMWMDLAGGGLTHILDHGMVKGSGDDYDYQVKANLSPDGNAAVYMTNNGNPDGPQEVVLLRFT